MKLKQSIYYQLSDFRWPIVVYYCAVIALHAVLWVADHIGPGSIYLSGTFSGFTAIFLFICGLCSFHDNLPMHLQNGVSRRTMFLAWLAVMGIVCGVMATVDSALSLIVDFSPLKSVYAATASASVYRTIYGFWNCLGPWDLLLSWLFSFALLVLVTSLGYFIIVFFYRLPFQMRIVVGVFLVLTMGPGQIGVKIVDQVLLHNFLADWFAPQLVYPVMDVIESNPFLNMGAWLLSAAALSGLTWLLLRKTVVRR